jgi:hypothetical protein
VPFPPNYGGVIDVYYKLVWLKKAGVKIHLHCFLYGRSQSKELEAICEKVYYYPRKTGLLSNLSSLPYTVKSRQSKELEKNLLSNNFPILFEVLHTCYLLSDQRFKNRHKIYRHSNIEHLYYQELSKVERNFLKKLYLRFEAKKLKKFEPIINYANVIAAVNSSDTAYFKSNYPKPETVYLPSFHSNSECVSIVGNGTYILFHGNLSISENYESLLWLAQHVFSKISHRVIVAGLNPPSFLVSTLSEFNNIQLINSPSEQEMNALISSAHIHVLYTKQPTGLKLKLLNSLFSGRFIVCNEHMISGTSLKQDSSLVICNSAQDYIKNLNVLMNQSFSQEIIAARKLSTLDFDCATNTKKLLELVKEV